MRGWLNWGRVMRCLSRGLWWYPATEGWNLSTCCSTTGGGATPGQMDSPMNALMLALMRVRDLPVEQRATWQEIFRHSMFAPSADTAEHIPEAARRSLALLADGREVARELCARPC